MNRFLWFCGGSKVLASLLLLNICLSLPLMLCGLGAQGSALRSVPYWFILSVDAQLLYRPWTLLTYMFVQTGVLHMLFNVLWLYWFGRIWLAYYPERSLLRLYIAGGLVAALAYIFWCLMTGAAGRGLEGSSGAVLALMTAVAVRMPQYPVNFLLVGEVKMKWLAPLAILLTIFGANAGSVAAHLGGVACGALCAIPAVMKAVSAPKLFEKRSKAGPSARGARRVATILEDRRRMHERLDELLDKVRISGYESLSRKERKELDDISALIGQDN